MREVLFLVLGWLFGLLSPSIVSRIEKKYKHNDLKVVIKNELENLSFRLAGTYFLLQKNLGNMNKTSLGWVKSIYVKHGKDVPKEILEGIEELLRLPQEQFEASQNATKAKENTGLGLKSFSLPFIESILENITIFDSKFQRDILNIRDKVSLLNEEIQLSMNYFNLTFDVSVMNANSEIIRNNIKKSYEVIQYRCKFIVDIIEKILKCN